MYITEQTILFQGSRGDPTFSRGGGSNFFPEGGGGGGGPNANFYRNPYNLCFDRGGGSGPPIPLWFRTCNTVNILSRILLDGPVCPSRCF